MYFGLLAHLESRESTRKLCPLSCACSETHIITAASSQHFEFTSTYVCTQIASLRDGSGNYPRRFVATSQFSSCPEVNLISQEKLLERNYPALPCLFLTPHILPVIYTNTSRPFNLRSRHSASSESNLCGCCKSLSSFATGEWYQNSCKAATKLPKHFTEACAHCFWLIVEHSYRQQSAGMLALALAVSHVLLCKSHGFFLGQESTSSIRNHQSRGFQTWWSCLQYREPLLAELLLVSSKHQRRSKRPWVF